VKYAENILTIRETTIYKYSSNSCKVFWALGAAELALSTRFCEPTLPFAQSLRIFMNTSNLTSLMQRRCKEDIG
jgi:hypothetical protein